MTWKKGNISKGKTTGLSGQAEVRQMSGKLARAGLAINPKTGHKVTGVRSL